MSDAENTPIRVLIVDDSAVVREILARELARDPQIEVVATAADPYIAREKIIKYAPDVLTLDIEMPRMNGVTFLRKLMTHHPVRTIVLSSLAEPGAQAALDALALGAIEVMGKPQADLANSLPEMVTRLIEQIKVAAVARLPEAKARPFKPKKPLSKRSAIRDPALSVSGGPVIGIGASTGGTEALKRLLSCLPEDMPGMLVVIHMPEGFTRRFAERLNEICLLTVREAVDGDVLLPGLVLLARGGQHLLVERSGGRHVVHLRNGPPVNRHKPAIDVLLHSLAEANGSDACGVLLTGMGADGADGMVALRRAGAETIVQDEASCVVFGMPKVAIERGGAGQIKDIDAIAPALVEWHRKRTGNRPTLSSIVEPNG